MTTHEHRNKLRRKQRARRFKRAMRAQLRAQRGREPSVPMPTQAQEVVAVPPLPVRTTIDTTAFMVTEKEQA